MVQYKTFVQPGRVALITHGPQKNRICMIVEIIDQNRVLIDGPCTNVPRRTCNLKKLHLTSILADFPHGSGTHVVMNAWKKAKVDAAWKKTSLCKKLERKAIRSKLTDFERFEVMMLKKKRSALLRSHAIKNSVKSKKAAKPAAKKVQKAKK